MPGVEQTKTAGLGTLWDFIIYGGIVCATGVLLFFLLRDVRQTLAAVTFIATVLGTLMFWKFRVGIAFLGLVLLLFTRAVDLTTAIDFMQLDVILFLVAMMVIVGVLRQSGFFRWLLVRGLRLTNFEPIFVLIAIMILAGVMAALVDEVTSILFTAALVLELCDHLGINPVKYIISVVLATNIGSSWTVLGNPIGILIAFRSGLTFEDFLTLAMPVGAISLFFLIGIVLIWNIKDFPELREVYKLQLATGGARDQAADAGVRFLDEWAIIKDRKLFIGREYIQRDVDWWTLVFFMFLFAEAGCLQYIGITDRIADAMLNLARDANVQIPIVLMLWVSGFLSAIADNVVVVAGLIPVAQALSTGLGSVAPWWALLFGGCYGGNMTMIGSTANIVALGMLERKTGHLITIGYWLKIGLLASLVPMAIATGALLIFR
jgi:Na+/H+ antiporter NhaD/arsenite permease-like protein